jgi:outer membrane receptor protein involved in Fe transport
MIRVVITFVFVIFFINLSLAQDIRIITDTTNIPDVIINEVTVKSPKEFSDIKEVPASISIISARIIENSEIKSLTDISSAVPNFFMLDYGSKLQSSVFIRGIGSRLGTPSVGLYVDNVPFSEKTTFGFDFFDIERVEVLRGPHGTLYGRNTMGGIINVFSKSPLFYDETTISASAGTYGYYNLNVNHYNTINDKFGYSVSGNYMNHDGYFTNDYNGEKADKQNSGSGRIRLVWKISERFLIENIASFEKSKQFGFPYALYDDETNTAGNVNYDQESGYERDLFSNGLVLKYRNDIFEILSTTSYTFYDGLMALDQDYTAERIYFFETGDKQNMLSQEVVFKSASEKNYNWLFGVYGFTQTMDQQTIGDIYTANMKQDILSDFEISGFALFHQSTFNDFLIDNLSLTAGIRLDLENDKLDYSSSSAIGDGPWRTTTEEKYNETFTQVLPKLAVKYAFNKSLHSYATVSKGYKSGGFNTNSSIDISEYRSYDAEHSWNYELGFKSSLANNKVYFDAALFYIDWQNQQIDVPVPNGRGNMKTNAGKSASQGVELFAKAYPGKGFELTFGYGYTHAKFKEYIVTDELNYNDNFIPYVPASTISAGANKSVSINNKLLDKIVAHLNYKGVGKHYWDLENSVSQDYYGLLDAKLSFVRKNIQLDIWGKNLLNTSYNTYYFVISTLKNSYAQLGKPVSIGVNLKVTF